MTTATRGTKEVVQSGFDALNDRDREAFVDLHADDAVIEVFGEEIRGTDAIVDNQFGLFDAFSDLTYTPDAVVAEDDTVVARWTAAGTHDGEFEGLEPTGTEIEFPVMGTFRVENGRLADVRILADQLGLLQQLGVVEPPAEATDRPTGGRTDDTMTTTRRTNEDVVRSAFDALNERDREAFVDRHVADVVLHMGGEDVRGIEAIADAEFAHLDAFPDLDLTLENVLVEGDTVAARWTATGTHERRFEGIEPTGAEVEFSNMGMFRVEGGKVAEVWLEGDRLGMYGQLGVVEPPSGEEGTAATRSE